VLFRLAMVWSAAVQLSAAVLAIRNVTLIDGTGAPAMRRMTIVARGERIVELGSAASTPIPKGARVIDGRGRYAIPGLWDMHVHLWYAQNQLPVYVANGITGVRDMGSDYARTSAWRKDVESGKLIGPHIVTPGPPVAGKPSSDPKLPVIVVTTPADARNAYDQLDDMDVDFIKVLSDVPRDAYFALAERARKWRTAFAGHVPSSITAREAIDSRIGSMEHLFGIFLACSSEEAEIRAGKSPPSRVIDTFDEAKARALFKKSALFETRQVPTLTFWERMTNTETAARVRDPRLRLVPEAIRATWPKPDQELKIPDAAEAAQGRRQMELAFRIVKLMAECGVEIMAGTDTGDPYTIPGITLDRELELLVKAGLTPMEALRTATAIPARYLEWDEAVGTLKKGMVADIVLLDADPLADIRNVSRVLGVSIRGKYLGRAQLAAILNAANRPGGVASRLGHEKGK
jgi:imidazolonepropionase-like amidohydrolase